MKDAVGLQRGLKGMMEALKFGSGSIKSGLRDQLAELKSDSRDQEGMAEDESGKKAYPSDFISRWPAPASPNLLRSNHR